MVHSLDTYRIYLLHIDGAEDKYRQATRKSMNLSSTRRDVADDEVEVEVEHVLSVMRETRRPLLLLAQHLTL